MTTYSSTGHLTVRSILSNHSSPITPSPTSNHSASNHSVSNHSRDDVAEVLPSAAAVLNIKDIPFSNRKEALKRKVKSKQPDKLIYATQYSWKLIKNNTLLNQIFPTPPIKAYKANPSLKKKLVRAKLKPLDQTNLNLTPNPSDTQDENQPIIEPNYPFNLFKHTPQNYRNPVKQCNNKCNNCMKMETKSFAYSATKATKTPISPPQPNQHYNCMSRNIVYLTMCKYKNCGAQYVGYSMRQL